MAAYKSRQETARPAVDEPTVGGRELVLIDAAHHEMDIVDTAAEAGSLETLLTAAQEDGLVDALKSDGPLTVFAPTDEAFAALPDGTVEGLLADPDKLGEVLKYHVVAGKLMSGDVMAVTEIETLQGQPIMVSDLRISKADMEASNSVIHVIDVVLIPSM